MLFIMTLWKIFLTILNYCLLTLTVYAMKYVMKTLMKNEHKEYFDLSNYSKNSKYFCNDDKKVLGKVKDEYGGNAIREFIGLR